MTPASLHLPVTFASIWPAGPVELLDDGQPVLALRDHTGQYAVLLHTTRAHMARLLWPEEERIDGGVARAGTLPDTKPCGCPPHAIDCAWRHAQWPEEETR